VGGTIESEDVPDGEAFAAHATFVWSFEPAGDGAPPLPPDFADSLRVSGVAESLVAGYEERAVSDPTGALNWLYASMDRSEERPLWLCQCGEQLLDDEWTGRATVRCDECGARWAVDSGGGQAMLSEPSDEWMAANPPPDPFGAFDPITVVEVGLPPWVDSIEPGTAFPIASWVDGDRAAVLYARRASPLERRLGDDEHGMVIESLHLDQAAGWSAIGGFGGSWIDPFAPPPGVLERLVVIDCGSSSSTDEHGTVHLVGGICSGAVAMIEVDAGQVRRTPMAPTRRAFVVGSRSRGIVRFLDADGHRLVDAYGRPVQRDLGAEPSSFRV
jgi:hypothetical protein